MAKKKAKRRKTLAKHVLIFTLLLAVVFILRIASTELPQSFVDAISRAVSTEHYSVELGRASISLLRGRLDVGSLEIYEKGVLGNALVEMKDVSIKIRPKRQSHHRLRATWSATKPTAMSGNQMGLTCPYSPSP